MVIKWGKNGRFLPARTIRPARIPRTSDRTKKGDPGGGEDDGHPVPLCGKPMLAAGAFGKFLAVPVIPSASTRSTSPRMERRSPPPRSEAPPPCATSAASDGSETGPFWRLSRLHRLSRVQEHVKAGPSGQPLGPPCRRRSRTSSATNAENRPPSSRAAMENSSLHGLPGMQEHHEVRAPETK